MKTKNANLRGKCCQYLLCILTNYPIQILEKNISFIEEIITSGLNEAALETRATARECFQHYSQILPEQSTILLNKLPPASQKAILDSAARKSISSELPKEKASPMASFSKTTSAKFPHKSPNIQAKLHPDLNRSSTSPKSKRPVSDAPSPFIIKSKGLPLPSAINLHSQNERSGIPEKPKPDEETWVGGPLIEEISPSQSGFEEIKDDPYKDYEISDILGILSHKSPVFLYIIDKIRMQNMEIRI